MPVFGAWFFASRTESHQALTRRTKGLVAGSIEARQYVDFALDYSKGNEPQSPSYPMPILNGSLVRLAARNSLVHAVACTVDLGVAGRSAWQLDTKYLDPCEHDYSSRARSEMWRSEEGSLAL